MEPSLAATTTTADPRVGAAVQLFSHVDGKYVLNDDAVESLKQSMSASSSSSTSTPFSVVAIVGTYRKGKSTFLNILQGGSSPGPFTVSSQAETCTRGILAFYDGGKHTLYLDVEGSDAPSMSTEKWCQYRMNALAMMLSSALLYWHWEGAISTNLSTLSSLCIFSERLRLLNADSNNNTTTLPMLVWLFRNWDESGLEVDPTRDYVEEQVSRADARLCEHLSRFPQFVTLDLPRPIYGKLLPQNFADPSKLVPEYLEQLAKLDNEILGQMMTKKWTSAALFFSLCRALELVINQEDFIPEYVKTANSVAHQTLVKDALQDAVKLCDRLLQTADLVDQIPMDDARLDTICAETEQQCFQRFDRSIIGILAQDDELSEAHDDLRFEIQRRLQQIRKQNYDQSVIVCQGLVAPLQEMYADALRAIELPQTSDEMNAYHQRTKDDLVARYDNKAKGVLKVHDEYREALLSIIDRNFFEKSKENLYKSELLCEQLLQPALDVYYKETGVGIEEEDPEKKEDLETNVSIVSNSQALMDRVAFVSDWVLHRRQVLAAYKAKAHFDLAASRCADFVVVVYQKKLVEKLQACMHQQTDQNAKYAEMWFRGLVPLVLARFRNAMDDELRIVVLPKDALDELSKKKRAAALEEFEAHCQAVTTKNDDDESQTAATDPNYSELLALQRSLPLQAHIQQCQVRHRQTLESELLEMCDEFEKTNSSRAETISHKLVAVSHAFYEKNMRLLSMPVPQDEFMSSHYENELAALENFLSKAVGTLDEIKYYEAILRERIDRSSTRLRLENRWVQYEGNLLKRSTFIHSWQPRYFVLRDGVLKFFETSTVEKKQQGHFAIETIEDVFPCEAAPSAKAVTECMQELRGGRPSSTGSPAGSVAPTPTAASGANESFTSTVAALFFDTFECESDANCFDGRRGWWWERGYYDIIIV
eukprot:PhM_4_TR7764/c0_g1_i1/m.45825